MARKLIVALLLLLIPAACSQSIITAFDPDEFRYVCKALDKDCSNIPPPIVVHTNLVEDYRWGTYGLYFHGEPYVFITSRVNETTNPTLSDVIVHETVHYVLYQTNPEMGRCASERIARRVTSKYMGLEYDPSWEVRYGCDRGEPLKGEKSDEVENPVEF